jgi:solute carrier family 50 protein (sugar transporter)
MDRMAMLKAVCLASGAAMHVAPIPTMREIRAARNTLNYHIAPYASTLLNHSVNLWYALIRQDGPLIIHRCAGIMAQSFYLWTYLSFCPPGKTADNKRWLSWVAGIIAGIFAELHVLLPLFGMSSVYNSHIAFFGAMTGIGLAASPLATVREVLRTKDASSLPFLLCAMVTLQCFSWMIYGYLREDLSTFSNNLVGVILGSIQLGLIYVYPSKRAAASGAVSEKTDRDRDRDAASPASSASPSSAASAAAPTVPYTPEHHATRRGSGSSGERHGFLHVDERGLSSERD